VKASSVVVRSVTKTYRRGQKQITALKDVSFEMSQGELALLVGPSGSGKTTLLNLIAALDCPDHRNHRRRIGDYRPVPHCCCALSQ
jgi:ABC-type lipoprotein export system ATPase subunit